MQQREEVDGLEGRLEDVGLSVSLFVHSVCLEVEVVTPSVVPSAPPPARRFAFIKVPALIRSFNWEGLQKFTSDKKFPLPFKVHSAVTMP